MAFRIPGEELDFTIYGGANTNHLQLSPVQISKLHLNSQRVHAAVNEEGPDLTGYQSGLFDPELGKVVFLLIFFFFFVSNPTST